MIFHEAEHAGIFYPEDKDAQDVMFRGVETGEEQSIVSDAMQRPAVVMVPQAAWTWSLGDIYCALDSLPVADFSLIVLLAPLHAPVMDIHQPAFVFSHTEEGSRTVQGDVLFAEGLRSALQEKFPQDLSLHPLYFTEEPGMEYLYPVLARKYPGVPVLPLLSGTADGPRVRILSDMLRALADVQPHTLFIIAGNLSADEHPEPALEHARTLQSAMEDGSQLLPLRAAGRISSASVPWLEGIRRAFGGSWKLLSARQSDGPDTSILPDEPSTSSHSSVVWHAAEILVQGRDS